MSINIVEINGSNVVFGSVLHYAGLSGFYAPKASLNHHFDYIGNDLLSQTIRLCKFCNKTQLKNNQKYFCSKTCAGKYGASVGQGCIKLKAVSNG